MDEQIPEQESAYLKMQADVGITKHMGGSQATAELIELCHITSGNYVLDVGCGIGTTACRLAKKHGCRVAGVDIFEKMVDWSYQRARQEGVEDQVEFRVADAQELSFEDGSFDVVICESVTAFAEDKQRAINEYVRVAKKGGYVGLNESTWIKSPPPGELVDYVSTSLEEVNFLTLDGWEELLRRSGLQDIIARPYHVSALNESMGRIDALGPRRVLGAWYRLVSLSIRNPAFRKEMKKLASASSRLPKNAFEYWGYGIYVGRKRS
jgi:arsenite methyltransferase